MENLKVLNTMECATLPQQEQKSSNTMHYLQFTDENFNFFFQNNRKNQMSAFSIL